jgi:hypothetical protein
MAISRFAASRLTQGLPKYQSAWDQDGVQQGAMVPIISRTQTVDENNYVISNIPQVYQDLRIVIVARGSDTAAINLYTIYPNGTLTGCSRTTIQGDGATPSSYRHTTSSPTYGIQCLVPGGGNTTNYWGIQVVDILNYASTSAKVAISRVGSDYNGAGGAELTVTNIANSAAITHISLSGTANLKAGTSVSVYGIKAGV